MNDILRGNTVGSLTQTQHAVLVGCLLGDGALRRQGNRQALLEINHAISQKEYVDWQYEVFRDLVITPPKPRLGNGSRVAYRFTTRSLSILSNYHQWFYAPQGKIISDDLKIGSLELAVWYMDDGSKSRSSCYFNTQQFSTDDQQRLIGLLWRTFGIEGRLNRDKKYQRIRITTSGTVKLYNIIGDYILPCFRYKLA
ncbi:MAG: hypothetical protein AAB337_01150 [Patescibacteria group bacterium]